MATTCRPSWLPDLYIVLVGDEEQGGVEPLECSICCEPIDEEFTGTRGPNAWGHTPCSHVFHFQCLRRWVGMPDTQVDAPTTDGEDNYVVDLNNKSCPLCRNELVHRSLEPGRPPQRRQRCREEMYCICNT